MIKNSITGASYFFRGLSLISKAGIRKFVIVPLIINVIIFSVLIAYGYQQFGELLDWLLPANRNEAAHGPISLQAGG